MALLTFLINNDNEITQYLIFQQYYRSYFHLVVTQIDNMFYCSSSLLFPFFFLCLCLLSCILPLILASPFPLHFLSLSLIII